MSPAWVHVAVLLLTGSAVLAADPTYRAQERIHPGQLRLVEYKPPRGPREDCFGRCRAEVTKCKQYAHATWGGVQRAFLINLLNQCDETHRACRKTCEPLENYPAEPPSCQPGWNAWSHKGQAGCCPPGQQYFAWGDTPGACVKTVN
jgi:hypothetical protein